MNLYYIEYEYYGSLSHPDNMDKYIRDSIKRYAGVVTPALISELERIGFHRFNNTGHILQFVVDMDFKCVNKDTVNGKNFSILHRVLIDNVRDDMLNFLIC